MKIQIPEGAKKIIEQLNAHGFEAYVVGGCVRDSLLGRTPEDWDITTSAKPETVKEVFKRTVDTGIQHGTVTVLLNKETYEVTTYRIDGEYEDARHPKTVEFTGDLLEDLKRRDFTINAMAYSDSDGLVDAFGGKMDLEQGVLRCVGNALDRFTEDALRILRAVRFSAQLGFEIETETKKAISAIAPNLEKVSKERVAAELTKLLLSDHPEQIEAVFGYGMGVYVSPHFEEAGKRLSHTEKLCLLASEKHMRWAGFLRKETAQNASRILRELKLDNDTINKTKTLVDLWKSEIPARKPDIRRVMSGLSDGLFRDLIDFQKIYCKKKQAENLKLVEQYAGEITKSGDCIRLKDMAVTGKDLLEAGRKPGPEIGTVLNALFREVLQFPEHNKKDYLMNLAEKL